MHHRYDVKAITNLWGYENQLAGWQEVELAVLKARVALGEMPEADYKHINHQLRSNEPNVEWWLAEEERTHHDLNAFLQERLRFIPALLKPWFHKGMTSYDTEESAFVARLLASVCIYEAKLAELMSAIRDLAFKYRYTPMMGVTHGQWADPQTFGKRAASWFQELVVGAQTLKSAKEMLLYSKLSGFVGNYTGISPKLEAAALEELGLKPYVGATQIIPRANFWPLASALAGLSKTVNNIAVAIRLGARSASVLYQEPFKAGQMGSSAGPHKKNTANCEKVAGMDTIISHAASAILTRVETWEERDIAESSMARVEWPNIFHASCHQVDTMKKIIAGLVVYPDNMMAEIVKTNGCYAANVAKEVLKELMAEAGLSANDCYRIVQLAAFNLGYPVWDSLVPQSLSEADEALVAMSSAPLEPLARFSIRDIIGRGELKTSDMVSAEQEQVTHWNRVLRQVFTDNLKRRKWEMAFELTNLLYNESYIFEQVFANPTPYPLG